MDYYKILRYRFIYAILIFLTIYGLNSIAGYYTYAEYAVKQQDDYIKTIKIIWVDDNPIAFYYAENGKIGIAQFNKKYFLNQIRYKISSYGSSGLPIGIAFVRYSPNNFFTFYGAINPQSQRILYGFSEKSSYKGIYLEGKSAEIVPFILKDKEYYIWYVIGGQELDKYKYKNLSKLIQ